jgi:heme oxygenase
MSLMNDVRTAIAESHNQIELTAFSVAMMDGTLPVDDYARGLTQLREIHRALEMGLSQVDTARGVFTPDMIRTPAIERDLISLVGSLHAFALLPQTQHIVACLNQWLHEKPVSLLGCLYILEGSRMGSLVIAKPLAKTLGLSDGSFAGIEYHVDGAAQTPARVRRLKEQLDQLSLSEEEREDLLSGAIEFMSALNELYSAIPVDRNRKATTQGKCPFSHASASHSHLKSA